jgi:hypothetical protein
VRLSHLSETEKRAYILADNKLAAQAGWDREMLAIELQGLLELDVDIELTGFDMPEVDLILDEAQEAKDAPAGPEDAVPEYAAGSGSPAPAISGFLDSTGCFVGMPASNPHTTPCSNAWQRSLCLRTPLTTCKSTAMSAVSAVSDIGTLQWVARDERGSVQARARRRQ